MKHSTLNALQRELVALGSPEDQYVKKKINNVINWLAAIVSAVVVARTAIKIKKAVGHPNPEMWE